MFELITGSWNLLMLDFISLP